jgi:transposase
MLQPPWVFTAPTDLPDDPATLQAILRAALSEIERLQLLIAGLQRNRFGRRSERLDDETLQHGIEDLEQSLAQQAAALEAAASPPEVPAPDAKATPRRTEPPKRNRGALPAHLPRVEVVIDVEVKACACCGGALHQIGEDRAEMLDYVPAQLRVRVIRRPRYGCRACEQAVVQAPAPERPIDGGMATEALLAHVLVNKFADHLPLYRQSQIFARQGVTLDRSTLCNWVGRACWWLAPMHELLLSTVLSSPKVVADDTTLPVLDPGRGRTKTGRLWCYATDNRGWCGPGYPAAAYLYTEDRKAEHPVSHLNGFRGLLQVDGYAGFARLVTSATEGAPRLAFCWAHARRKFYDIHVATKSPLAQEALTQIAALYAIEAEIRGQPAEQRQFVRRQRSRPLVEAMHGWLHRQLDRLSGRSALAQAIRYALNHWKGLILFLDDGRLELDTNIVERAMRPVALGRKNALFAGADSGAHNWSIIATLIQSAKLHEVEPLAWLADVLQRIVSGQTKRNQLHTLLPWNWKAEDEVPILNSTYHLRRDGVAATLYNQSISSFTFKRHIAATAFGRRSRSSPGSFAAGASRTPPCF